MLTVGVSASGCLGDAFLESAYLTNSEVRIHSTYLCSLLAFRVAGWIASSKKAPEPKRYHSGDAVLLPAVLK